MGHRIAGGDAQWIAVPNRNAAGCAGPSGRAWPGCRTVPLQANLFAQCDNAQTALRPVATVAAMANGPSPDWNNATAGRATNVLDRDAFGHCFRASFNAASSAALTPSLARLEAVAWRAYCEGRPAPFRLPTPTRVAHTHPNSR